MVTLPKDLIQWRWKDRTSEERKYVVYNRNVNALIKAVFRVVTSFPNDPNPVFFSPNNSQKSLLSPYSAPSSSKYNSEPLLAGTISTATQTESQNFDPQIDIQLTKSLWESEIAVAEFEEQNKALFIE